MLPMGRKWLRLQTRSRVMKEVRASVERSRVKKWLVEARARREGWRGRSEERCLMEREAGRRVERSREAVGARSALVKSKVCRVVVC